MLGSLVVLAIAVLLLFVRLGHYALWDDEAGTALIGEGVWQTGDTSVLLGKNIMAYRNGAELVGFKAHYMSPFQQYLAAPFVGTWPGSALAARLPFALLGVLTVALILWWMYRNKPPTVTWMLLAMGMVGNVSFWLFCRQSRYYALIIFLSVAIVYLYLHYGNRQWEALLIGFACAALFASNYLSYAALCGTLAVDWLIWGRKQFQPGWRGWLCILTPQLLLGPPIFWIWCPLGKSVTEVEGQAVTNHLLLFWWNCRDMNACEFGAVVLVLAAPLLWFWRRDRWLLRAPLALLTYVGLVSAASPQVMWVVNNGARAVNTTRADVRYLCPAIPLFIAISALVIASLVPRRMAWLAITLGIVVFFTNALQGGTIWADPQVNNELPQIRSTFLAYVRELANPLPDPYSAAARWVNANVQQGQSVLVLPQYMTYPLMYHAPRAVYAWQLDAAKRSTYPTLPAIDFKYAAEPDYIIVFGPGAPPAIRLHLTNHSTYLKIENINIFGMALYRPELMLHAFDPILNFEFSTNNIRIYQRIETR